MRITHTFILRLYSDHSQPDRLQGAVLTIADSGKFTFKGEQALLALLKRLNRLPGDLQNQGPDGEESQGEDPA